MLTCLLFSYLGCARGEIIEGNEMEREEMIEMEELGVEID